MGVDLSFVSMDEIWEELKKRHDAVVLIDMISLDADREQSQTSYKGGKFVCIGLLEKAKAQIMKEILGPSTMNGES